MHQIGFPIMVGPSSRWFSHKERTSMPFQFHHAVASGRKGLASNQDKESPPLIDPIMAHNGMHQASIETIIPSCITAHINDELLRLVFLYRLKDFRPERSQGAGWLVLHLCITDVDLSCRRIIGPDVGKGLWGMKLRHW